MKTYTLTFISVALICSVVALIYLHISQLAEIQNHDPLIELGAETLSPETSPFSMRFGEPDSNIDFKLIKVPPDDSTVYAAVEIPVR